MEYNSTTGAWLKVDEVKDGTKVKLVNECVKVESRFKDEDGTPKTENQVKAQFEGASEPVNMRLNWTTVYGLIEAFGKESKSWIGQPLTAMVKDATTGQSIYLIPEGSELIRDENKRWTIRKTAVAGEINPEEIPF